MDERTIARGVGLVSIGLGLFMTVAPSVASDLFGMTGYRRVVRLLGLRDLAIGAGLLSGRAPRRWAIARAVSDTGDAVMLASGAATGAFVRPLAVPGIGVALGFGGLGFWLARRLRRRKYQRTRPVRGTIGVVVGRAGVRSAPDARKR